MNHGFNGFNGFVPANAYSYGFIGLAAMGNLLNPQKRIGGKSV